MKVCKISLLFLISALFLTACSQNPADEIYDQPYQTGSVEGGLGYEENDRWARENLDLQAVGALLERAETAEEFEYRLNTEGVSNLDLNDDGYADYISVREFDERDPDERGFSLFSMFGPELIQEIATIIFDRNGYNDNGYYPGARVLLRGDRDLYGDNYYYETNWRDRSLPIVNWLFSDRDDYYRSPYYYENYPNYYEPYQIVETNVYRTRIREYYAAPVFIRTAQPTITEIKIVSPYKDKSLKKAYSKLPKPTREQEEFRRTNPGPPEFVREKQAKMKDFPVKDDKQFKDKPNRFEKPGKPEKSQMREPREKPNKPERVNFQSQKPAKVERPNREKFERPNMKPAKQENKPRSNGGGNKGGGGKGKGGKN